MLHKALLYRCISLLSTVAGLRAQANEGPNVPFPSVGVSTWFSVVNIRSIPKAPFSATTEMETTHVLADGTTVNTATMTTIARDSRGRTHNENRYYLLPRDKGQGRIRDITIFDPTTHSRTTLIPAAGRTHHSFAIGPAKTRCAIARPASLRVCGKIWASPRLRGLPFMASGRIKQFPKA
jgi:hypothetical protein